MSTALFAFLIVFGVLVGVLSAVLGVGGGIFMVPALVLIADFSQQEAQATSLLVIVPTAAVATFALQKKQIGDVRLAAKLAPLGILGAAGGAAVALAVSGQALRYTFALLLVIVGARLLWDARNDPEPTGGRR
ncbi:MAG TPA: sulfite exporter TauE/SafE family protein [Solirubrobacterales bacterium]|nr:sulfite exporter TauE/SafE family protein [Solirubrobacterales bacterium]